MLSVLPLFLAILAVSCMFLKSLFSPCSPQLLFAMCQFVANFLNCVSAKHYLNWFTVGKVITKIKKGELLLRHSVVLFR